MNDNSKISPDDIRELKAEYAAAMLSDETLADIAQQFDSEIPNDIFLCDLNVTEGMSSRIRVERNGVEVANISFKLLHDPLAPVDRMQWIKVNEGIPEKDQPFLYLTRNKKIMVCQNRPLDEWFIHKYAVTHWMYFPELPNE